MAVKVPPLLHKMSASAQKAWYKKHGMEMPDDAGGKSAAAAKKVKVAPRKTIAVEPGSVRALNAARQKEYMAKGGRQPIGAMGSGGSNVMAGSGQSTIKDLKASIKAGFNPKVSLDPYASEKAKKVGPRTLKLKEESIDEALSPERKRMFDLKLKLIKKAANRKDRAKPSKVIEPRTSLNPAVDMKLNPKPMDTRTWDYIMKNEEVEQIDEVTKKEAESVLGGAVKEKPKMAPGKQPAGYRYVRGLARKAMKAGMKKEEVEVVEAVKDVADVGEYDYEGDMAKSQLRSILANAKRMHDMLDENTNLPEWVQSKITLAEDYIVTAANYMEGEMNEGYGGKFPKEWQKEMEKIPSTSTVVHKDKTVVTTKKDGKVVDVRTTKNEEVEQIDELKKSTLASYVNKAANQVRAKSGIAASFETQGERKRDPERKASYMSLAKDYRKGARQRLTGIEKATAKLAREEIEQVTEAEGKVAVTPKEKELAAHHGDKTKITYGDVIKARLKSAAAKKMGK